MEIVINLIYLENANHLINIIEYSVIIVNIYINSVLTHPVPKQSIYKSLVDMSQTSDEFGQLPSYHTHRQVLNFCNQH